MSTKIRESVKVDVKKFAAYTVAGAAAALSGVQTAEADITHVVVGAGAGDISLGAGFVQFDVGTAASAQLAIGNLAIGTAGTAGAVIGRVVTTNGAGTSTAYAGFIAGFTAGAYDYADNFATASGAPQTSQFVSTQNFLTQTITTSLGATYTGQPVAGTLAFGPGYGNDQFLNTGGYVGFAFVDGNGDFQFGWARLSLTTGAPANEFVLEEYAFSTDGEPIAFGQTITAVPEPSSLGLLALGAIGLVSSRRRKSVV